MLLEQINSVHISADWSSRVWELPAFLIEWVVVRSAKFCYGLLALLAIAYLPRANPPHTHTHTPYPIPATPTRPAQHGWSGQQRRDPGFPDGGTAEVWKMEQGVMHG